MLKQSNNQAKKFRIIGFFLLFLSVMNEGAGQRALPDVSISIDAQNISLGELLTRITDKSGLAFSYNPKKIPIQQKTNFTAANKSLAQILTDLSQKYGLKFEHVENQIILKPDKRSGKIAAQTFTFSGTIKDSDTGEALIGASIFIHELQTGTVTNPFGFYSITIPGGIYNVSSSFIGYKDITRVVDLNGPISDDLSLVEEPPVLDEIIVTSAPTVTSQIRTSNTNIRPSAVEERPEFFGEMDVVKALESVPGVKFHSEGSTFYYVRGGHRDQNLVLIDDAPIYNPSHMLGIFSTIIPDAVNDITLYKGDMPASIGGRLSSVLDVRTKKGNDQHFQAWGSLGLISTKLGIEGPLKKNASSYLLSGRFSNFRWFFKRVGENIERFDFHDLTGKVNVRINPSNRIFLSFYSGADNYFGRNNGITWSNNAATIQWNHLFNDRLFLNTTIAAGGYDYFLYTDVKTDTKWNSHISNFNLKTDFSYFIRPENEITFGLGLNGYAFNPGNLQSSLNISRLPVLSVRNSAEFVFYANHELKLNNKLGVNYGVRLTSWSNSGEAFEYIFDETSIPSDTLYYASGERYNQFGNVEPRITVSYFLNDQSSLKTSFSRNVQNVHLISNSVSPFTSLDVWLPSSFNIKPQSANQVTLGYYNTLPLKQASFSAEAFYKKMLSQIDYDAHAEILLNPLLERELRFGTGTAFGIELLAKKDEGRLRGWIGYSWSRAKRKFAGINDGREYNAFYDRPHQINLMTVYDISTRWKLGADWNYSTGSPYSAPISFYSFNDEEVPVYGQKNNARLPDYHRLDVSATYRLNKNPGNKFIHTLSFSIFNFYGRKNALFVNYNKVETADGSLKIPANLIDPSRVTSQYYLFRFTPSISYNFKWL
ncbi:MAG: TonB-dependent receptor [Cyclobacteriaceae bacterium]